MTEHLLHLNLTPTCPDCGVEAGTPHLRDCDIARCVATGHARLSCPSFISDKDARDHDCGDDTWTGLWPGVAECAEYGWWTTERAGQKVRCPAGPESVPDFDRLTTDCTWDTSQQKWVRPAAGIRCPVQITFPSARVAAHAMALVVEDRAPFHQVGAVLTIPGDNPRWFMEIAEAFVLSGYLADEDAAQAIRDMETALHAATPQ